MHTNAHECTRTSRDAGPSLFQNKNKNKNKNNTNKNKENERRKKRKERKKMTTAGPSASTFYGCDLCAFVCIRVHL